ncbi:MAG: GTP-binding protein [Candidatus Sumerlaeota bacterium]|nr:GTP-binding protein [Candidatus Sumerlaeota bacterium]
MNRMSRSHTKDIATSEAPETTMAEESHEQMTLVVVGHVDHGKSTLIGRLLADSGALPQGKLEQVREQCRRTARPFEYAFLLDALKAEQSQGITIDTARCFFKTARRRYIINDAPGHVEFIKNMVTGAARAEAALLLIDAAEGIRENSKRHGTILSMLGIKQVAVLVNKMDLMGFRQDVFDRIRSEYLAFLNHLGVHPLSFIPISARDGINLTALSPEMPWYRGATVLEQIESFENKDFGLEKPFRMPVQDIYKFTEQGDDRRIIAGTIETGALTVGDQVVFLPSGKRTIIQSIESFNSAALQEARAGQAAGFTLSEQIYIKPGEMMCRANETPARVSTRLRVNLFWMGHSPMIRGKRYKIKIGAARVPGELVHVFNVLDASDLAPFDDKWQIDRHDLAECLIETARPVAYDLAGQIEETSRLVIVDGDIITGCAIVLEADDGSASLLEGRVREREIAWDKGLVTAADRESHYQHPGKFIVFTGAIGAGARVIAKQLERKLWREGLKTYYLSVANLLRDLTPKQSGDAMGRDEQLQRLGELARIMTDAGMLFITALADADDYDFEKLRLLTEPHEFFVITVGETPLERFPAQARLQANPPMDEALAQVVGALTSHGILPEYEI